jgi:hypothetical protein
MRRKEVMCFYMPFICIHYRLSSRGRWTRGQQQFRQGLASDQMNPRSLSLSLFPDQGMPKSSKRQDSKHHRRRSSFVQHNMQEKKEKKMQSKYPDDPQDLHPSNGGPPTRPHLGHKPQNDRACSLSLLSSQPDYSSSGGGDGAAAGAAA